MENFNKKDLQAEELVKTILVVPYFLDTETGETIKREDCSAWNMYENSDIGINCLLLTAQKAISDGFELEEYYLYEIPFYNNECTIIYFVHKQDYDDFHWYKKDNDMRSIVFICEYDQPYGKPCKEVCDEKMGTHLVEVKTCQEAVFIFE